MDTGVTVATTLDERLDQLVNDVPAFKALLDEECEADMKHGAQFRERAHERFAGRKVACAAHLGGLIKGNAMVSLLEGRTDHFVSGLRLGMAVSLSGTTGAEAAAALMALGYALALADLAAVPPDDGAAAGS